MLNPGTRIHKENSRLDLGLQMVCVDFKEILKVGMLWIFGKTSSTVVQAE